MCCQFIKKAQRNGSPFAPVGAEYSAGVGGVGLMTTPPPFPVPKGRGNFRGLSEKTPAWGAELIIELDRNVYVWVKNRHGRYK